MNNRRNNNLNNETLLSFPVLKNDTQMGFNKNVRQTEESRQINITFQDATRNIGVFGGTGSGKTTCAMKPVIQRLLSTGCAGFICDVKGEFTQMVRAFPNKLVILGNHPKAMPINLLAGCDISLFRGMMELLLKMDDPNGPQEQLSWTMQGVKQAEFVFEFCKLTEIPTLKKIHDYLANPGKFCRKLENYLELSRKGFIQ
ncbi:MAG: DUF853 family protein [SAR324 cluster bacterium]|nr:DUF853 family protein [SAR324 cluster bacterium]